MRRLCAISIAAMASSAFGCRLRLQVFVAAMIDGELCNWVLLPAANREAAAQLATVAEDRISRNAEALFAEHERTAKEIVDRLMGRKGT
jgi:hypothetical protein